MEIRSFGLRIAHVCRFMLGRPKVKPPIVATEISSGPESVLQDLAEVAGVALVIGRATIAVGTNMNVGLLADMDWNEINPKRASYEAHLAKSILYEELVHSEALQLCNRDRVQEDRVLHKVAELYPEFRIWPKDEDYDPNSEHEVQLRPAAGGRRLAGITKKG